MALKGKPPTAVQKRLKLLMFGPAGVGKTTAAIQFPRPYLIDTEKGAENESYVKLLNEAGGAYFHTTDADELIDEVKALLSEKHEFRTVIIDPLTVIYNEMLDKAAAALATKEDPTGTAWGRHKAQPDRKIKHLLTLLVRADMNVVITSHAKPNWVRSKDGGGKDQATQDGITFDCYGRLDYLFDLVLEVGKRGKDRVCTVRKTRIDTLPEGDIFPFSYNEIADRYGREVLERDAVPVVLATPEQIAELNELLAPRADKDELLAKWLDKAEAENPSEMTTAQIAACIGLLLKKGTK